MEIEKIKKKKEEKKHKNLQMYRELSSYLMIINKLPEEWCSTYQN